MHIKHSFFSKNLDESQLKNVSRVFLYTSLFLAVLSLCFLGTGEVTFETLTQAAEAIKKFDHTALEGWPLRLAIIGHSASADS